MDAYLDLPASVDTSVSADPTSGIVKWSAAKSLWWLFMTIVWFWFAASTISISTLLLFLTLTATTLCLGHSLGMHRKLIHRAFDCPKWLERILVYLSSLVGLGGPFTMMRTHDTRDWAQRLTECHPFLSHQNSLLKDFYWQLHCKLHLHSPPVLQYPESIERDRFYRHLQATSILHQALLAIVLYVIGGWAWIVWGICARVSASVLGHWLVGYFAHNMGQRSWHVNQAAVQGYNINGLGLITFGECWHNNHHAFPGSAKLGLEPNQFDPGWQVLRVLHKFNLVWNIITPKSLPYRKALERMDQSSEWSVASKLVDNGSKAVQRK